MRIVEKAGGILEYVTDENETPTNQAFIAKMAQYKIVRQGASICFYDKTTNKLILYFNPFDNTLFINDPSGYALAAEFGAKRFPVGGARTTLTEEKAKDEKAMQFSRDISFPLQLQQDVKEVKSTPFRVVSLKELLIAHSFNQDVFYNDMAELFNRCADFTPGKQEEYLKGGKKADKFCRFNLESQQPDASVVTEQIFLVDDKNKVMGTISATIIVQPDGVMDVYFYDEVVDYFSQLTVAEKENLQRLCSELSALQENKEQVPDVKLNSFLNSKRAAIINSKKTAIAVIVEPKRAELMATLFAAARQKIRPVLSKRANVSEQELDKRIEAGMINAFIRAAAGRESAYQALGCGKNNSKKYVIHGLACPPAAMLDAHVKKWATQKLSQLSKGINSYLTPQAFSYGLALLTFGVIVAKLWSGGKSSESSSPVSMPSSLGHGLK